MKAIIYARVSSKEQEESGFSLPSQEKLLRSYNERKEMETVKVYTVAESASGKIIRETYKLMLDYASKQNIKHLIFEKVDRATRNFKEAEMVNDWLEADSERRIHSVKDSIILHKNSTSQEKLNWNIRVVLAKNYIDNLSEEVKKGQKEKIAQGGYPSAPPIGYVSMGDKGRRYHVPDPRIAPLIKKMFSLYAKQMYSTRRLATFAEENGIRSRSNKKLSNSRVYDMITNPYYYGKFRWNNVTYQGTHEGIISEELFNAVQEVLKGKATSITRKREHLFRGAIRCKECGGAISWEEHKGHVYGHCNHFKECSQRTWHKQENIEAELIKHFDCFVIKNPQYSDWIIKALKEQHKDEIENQQLSMSELNHTHEMLTNRLDRLYDDKLDGIITTEVYNRKFVQYSEEKDKTAIALRKQSEIGTKYYELGSLVFELSQEATNTYRNRKKNEDKRQLIRVVFDRIELTDNTLEAEYTPAFAELARVIEKTNSSIVHKTDENSDDTLEPAYLGLMETKRASSDSMCSIWRAETRRNQYQNISTK